MKVICNKKTAHGLDLKEVTTLCNDAYDYWLEVGKEYLVMGISIHKDSNCLYYLIDENGRPDWFPYLLFTISDNSFPKNWSVEVIDKKTAGNIFVLMGFYELCNDEDFHDLLVERDYNAMYTYFQRKIELENAEKEELW